jgi:hypothetical protein
MKVTKKMGRAKKLIKRKKRPSKKNQKTKKLKLKKKDINQMIDTYFDLCNNLLWK